MKLTWSSNASVGATNRLGVLHDLRSKGFTDRQIQDHNMVDKIFLHETTIVKICMTTPTGSGIAGSLEGSTREYDDRYDAPWDNSGEIDC